jgi:hypothetical protein
MRIRSVTEAKIFKVKSELVRGNGGILIYDYPVPLEPPFAPFEYGKLNEIDLTLLRADEAFEPDPLKRVVQRVFKTVPSPSYRPEEFQRQEPFSFLKLTLPAEDEPTPLLAEQFLLSFNNSEPVSFEIIGDKHSIVFQLVCPERNGSQIASQLELHYPQIGIRHNEDDFLVSAFAESETENPEVVEYNLAETYFHPLLTFKKFDVDPLGMCISALSTLKNRELGAIQILIVPAKEDWRTNIRLASRNEYDASKPALYDYPILKAADEKNSKPLFAVMIRLIATDKHIIQQLEGFLNQFSSPHNQLVRFDDNGLLDEMDKFLAISTRVSFRSGLLLNCQELAGLVHLPSPVIKSDKLARGICKTAPVPDYATGQGMVLGENIHRGRKTAVTINDDYRNRHVYFIGATRVGKTTLMLDMILQDIENGKGLGVVDPHGDLIKEEILPRIPKNRIKDVVYINPDDRDYPVSLNILHSSSTREKELLASDLMVIFQRLFGESWGVRMEHLLRFFILTLMEKPDSSLRDIRRLVDDVKFRNSILKNVTDSELVDFWENEFESYEQSAFAPLRNKIGKFLAYPTIRYMITQRENKVDFEEVMDSGKILLCNLSQGELGEEISGILGALVVSRIQIAAMSRAKKPKEKRRDFYLYVDEFQNYITTSFEKILSEAGKYRLNLVLANQYLKQIPEKLRAAILDNVGTLVCFKSGVDVAWILGRELGVFTKDDILNLNRGEAIVRMGSARDAFNLKTFLPPGKPQESNVSEVIAHSRNQYATPLKELEEELKRERTKTDELKSADDFYEQ